MVSERHDASTPPGRNWQRARAWRLVGGAWVVAIVLITLWLVGTPGVLLREQLRRWQFWSLELCFALLIALGAFVARGVWRQL